jgi:hypothetical protein
MIWIAHRGNTNGTNPEKENHPDYIKEAISKGFQVEIDVWNIADKYYLGHDNPQYEVNGNFLINSKLWCHAKNLETFMNLTQPGFLIHTFLHDTDPAAVTSMGFIWTYPGYKIINSRQIAVMPERVKEPYDISLAGGICSDYIEKYKKDINFKK